MYTVDIIPHILYIRPSQCVCGSVVLRSPCYPWTMRVSMYCVPLQDVDTSPNANVNETNSFTHVVFTQSGLTSVGREPASRCCSFRVIQSSQKDIKTLSYTRMTHTVMCHRCIDFTIQEASATRNLCSHFITRGHLNISSFAWCGLAFRPRQEYGRPQCDRVGRFMLA